MTNTDMIFDRISEGVLEESEQEGVRDRYYKLLKRPASLSPDIAWGIAFTLDKRERQAEKFDAHETIAEAAALVGNAYDKIASELGHTSVRQTRIKCGDPQTYYENQLCPAYSLAIRGKENTRIGSWIG